MREIILWAADGTYSGAVDDRDLFGTSYPWFCSGSKLSDGSILVIMTDTRSDERLSERQCHPIDKRFANSKETSRKSSSDN